MNKKIVSNKGKIIKDKITVSNNLFTWKKILLLVTLVFMTALTIVFTQNRQIITQYADVTYSSITPVYHCLTFGNTSSCKDVAAQTAACTSLAVTTPLKITPTSLLQGQSVQATITYKNNCAGQASFSVGGYTIVATDPSNKTHTFLIKNGGSATIINGVTAAVTGTLTIGPNDPPGTWKVAATYTDSTGAQSTPSNATFTVCGPLTISGVTLKPTSLSPGQSLTGQATLKNACAAPYPIQDVKIETMFTPPQKSTITHDFTITSPTNRATTIPANSSLPVNGSLTTDTADPLGTWKVLAYYKNTAGTWIPGKTISEYTLVKAAATAPGTKPPATKPGSTTKACPAGITNTVTVLYPTYTGGTVSVPSSYNSQLTSYAAALKSNTTITVTVDGYTDATPFAAGTTGSITNNQQLSAARATAVEKYLTSKGAPAKNVTATGKGITPGATSNDAAARKAVITASCGTPPAGTGTGVTSGNPTTSSLCQQQQIAGKAMPDCEINTTHKNGTGGYYYVGYCPGAANNQCWVPGATSSKTASVGSTCKAPSENVSDGCTCPSNGFVVGGVCNVCPAGQMPGAGYRCIQPAAGSTCKAPSENTNDGCTCPSNGFVLNGICNVCPAGQMPGAGYRCVTQSPVVITCKGTCANSCSNGSASGTCGPNQVCCAPKPAGSSCTNGSGGAGVCYLRTGDVNYNPVAGCRYGAGTGTCTTSGYVCCKK